MKTPSSPVSIRFSYRELESIDEMAKEEGKSRSVFLKELIKIGLSGKAAEHYFAEERKSQERRLEIEKKQLQTSFMSLSILQMIAEKNNIDIEQVRQFAREATESIYSNNGKMDHDSAL